jgi:hypothetical protein
MTEDHMKPARPEDLPMDVSEGTMEAFGITLRTFVLDDGRRIIDGEDFHKLLAVLSVADDQS